MKKFFIGLLRHHITALLAITAVNIFLGFTDTYIAICFSLLFPQKLFFKGIELAITTGVSALSVCGIVLAAICALLFVVCLIASYRSAGWLIVSASMLLADTAYGVYLMLSTNDFSYHIDIVTHAWCILALTLAAILIMAGKKKTKAPAVEIPAEPAPIVETAAPLPAAPVEAAPAAEPVPVKKHTRAVISPEFLKPAERKYSRRR